jgi:hypothetical protein
MNKKAGLLIGAGVGAAVAWYLRRQDRAPVILNIVVEPNEKGVCRVSGKPAFTELHFNQKIFWKVINNCTTDVRVALERWRDQDQNGTSVAPAAISEDDANDPQAGLWRKVKAGHMASIKGRGRFPLNILGEVVHYDVYLNDELGADPIVKLIL